MSKTCPHCGYVVPADTRPMPSEDNVLKCPNCGKDVQMSSASDVGHASDGTRGAGSDAVDRGPVGSTHKDDATK